MLQQTQALRVVPHLRAVPADVPDGRRRWRRPTSADVLRAWENLGYNRRALNLWRTAQAVVARGGFPRTSTSLAALPGIGPYTARAVASFAFDADVAAVDANVRRVVARLFGVCRRRDVQALADGLVPRGKAAAWNQAMIDLGAEVCRPATRAAECPVRRMCAWSAGVRPPRARETAVRGHHALRARPRASIACTGRHVSSSTRTGLDARGSRRSMRWSSRSADAASSSVTTRSRAASRRRGVSLRDEFPASSRTDEGFVPDRPDSARRRDVELGRTARGRDYRARSAQLLDVADDVAASDARDQAASLQQRERLVHALACRADHLREALLRERDVDHRRPRSCSMPCASARSASRRATRPGTSKNAMSWKASFDCRRRCPRTCSSADRDLRVAARSRR